MGNAKSPGLTAMPQAQDPFSQNSGRKFFGYDVCITALCLSCYFFNPIQARLLPDFSQCYFALLWTVLPEVGIFTLSVLSQLNSIPINRKILECVEKEKVTEADKSRAYVFAFLMFISSLGKVSL
jgi:hypothetical protein